jgi:hypothetical protein
MSQAIRKTFDPDYEGIVGAASYMANPLDSCTVVGILASIKPAYRTFNFDVRVSFVSVYQLL